MCSHPACVWPNLVALILATASIAFFVLALPVLAASPVATAAAAATTAVASNASSVAAAAVTLTLSSASSTLTLEVQRGELALLLVAMSRWNDEALEGQVLDEGRGAAMEVRPWAEDTAHCSVVEVAGGSESRTCWGAKAGNTQHMRWYGGAETYNQAFPDITPVGMPDQPYYSNMLDNGNENKWGSVLQPFWLTSLGISIFQPDSEDFSGNLHASWRADPAGISPPQLCLRSAREGYNFGASNLEKAPPLRYVMCADKDVRNSWDLRSLAPRGNDQLSSDDVAENLKVVKSPIWSTWVQFKYGASQANILTFAEEIARHDYPRSTMEIDYKWNVRYGDFEFDPEKFPDPAGMVANLAKLGFFATLSITPFFEVGSDGYEEAVAFGFLVGNISRPLVLSGSHMRGAHASAPGAKVPQYEPAHVYWWDGAKASEGQPPNSGLLDVTNPWARAWFASKLRDMMEAYGIAGFKFDAGEAAYLPKGGDVLFWESIRDRPMRYAQLWAQIAGHRSIGGRSHNEVRSSWYNQVESEHGLFTRVFDVLSSWSCEGGFGALLPRMLSLSTLGYRFVLGDMVGGNGYADSSRVYVLDGTVLPLPELYVRWAQMFTLLPMQFSIAPWHYAYSSADGNHSENDVASMIDQVFALRSQLMPYLEAAARQAALPGGQPLIRPLWSIEPAPSCHVGPCNFEGTQFLVGDSVMFAPILDEGAVSRLVYFPGKDLHWRPCDLSRAHVFYHHEVVQMSAPLNTTLCFLAAPAAMTHD